MEQYSPSRNSLIPIGLQNSMNTVMTNAKNSIATVANSIIAKNQKVSASLEDKKLPETPALN